MLTGLHDMKGAAAAGRGQHCHGSGTSCRLGEVVLLLILQLGEVGVLQETCVQPARCSRWQGQQCCHESGQACKIWPAQHGTG